MIVFPNAKINLGLRITGRRPDGYHNIHSLMLPVSLCDILEIVPGTGEGLRFEQMGKPLDCNPDDNLVVRALRALERETGRALPPLDIYLEKHIPFGAGLGGGSADASFALKAANELLGFGLDKGELCRIAATVGADCPFFIADRPVLATGTGTGLTPVDASALNGLVPVIAKPHGPGVATAAAYAGVRPRPLEPGEDLARAIAGGLGASHLYINDFETSVFAVRPDIRRLKEAFLAAGAEYASMTGSGAAVVGLFRNATMAENAADAIGGDVHVCNPFDF